ncbi:MAG: DUF2911 domain-containing protein [Gemmatimonadaceae bacterium]
MTHTISTISGFRRVTRLAITVAIFALPGAASAQGYPFSQRQHITQNIALTEVDIEYGRPVARGRELFGKLVPWDTIWHPGADAATRITFKRDVLLEGHEVKAGTYSLWLIPRPNSAWTFIVSKTANVSHLDYAGPTKDALRVDIMPETQSHLESMTWHFPMVLKDDAILRFQWGTTSLSIKVKAPYKPA